MRRKDRTPTIAQLRIVDWTARMDALFNVAERVKAVAPEVNPRWREISLRRYKSDIVRLIAIAPEGTKPLVRAYRVRYAAL